jgi:phage tail sheath protein FI
MATQPKTPGVYISEPNSFPPSIVGVDTAVPAFVGYTESDRDKAKPVHNTPVKITSMAEYAAIFGGPYTEKYYLLPTGGDAKGNRRIGTVSLDDVTSYDVIEIGLTNFNLYNSLRLYFANGGGECYIVSCGTYVDADGNAADVTSQALQDGIDSLANVVGPTILVVPDAALIADQAGYNELAVRMLRQCLKKQDRVAVLDVWFDRTANPPAKTDAIVDAFRSGMAGAPPDSLRYGMAYYPNLVTSVVKADDVSIYNLSLDDDYRANVVTALKGAAKAAFPDGKDGKPSPRYTAILDNLISVVDGKKFVKDGTAVPEAPTGNATRPMTARQLTQGLRSNLPRLNDLFDLIATSQNILPPSGAIAGLYVSNDSNAGVWNAPANVGIAGVIKPCVDINDDQQEDLNVPTNGLSVNAIRTFVNRGTLVWGARTLDGTSNDWRYIQVRRTMIFIEQSVKVALNRFVFAPNTAQTWVTVTSMIESFLHGVWARGGLMGTSPDQAYNVQCGLGSTMTPDDILNGNMLVSIVLQMVHPAEFIQLTFKQQMLGGS